jgi:hypothetical protein
VAEHRPEEPVRRVYIRARPFPFKHGELLAERENFKGDIASAAKEDSDGGKEGEGEFEHEVPVLP